MARQSREPREGYVAVGRVLRPWGLRGDLKVLPLTDFLEDRFASGSRVWLAGSERTVQHARTQKGDLYLKLVGIDDATAAEHYRGELLEVPEAALPPLAEDEFYHHQLIGLRVRTAAGEELGAVTEVLPTGASPALVVRGPAGEIVLPFIDDVVKTVDLGGGALTVELMEGLLPEPKAPPRTFVPRRYRPRAPRST